MEFSKVMKSYERMCNSFPVCFGCPLDKIGMPCYQALSQKYEQAEKIIMDWASKNPAETYLSRLLKQYPNTVLDHDGTPREICPKSLGLPQVGSCDCNCLSCWNKEVQQ